MTIRIGLIGVRVMVAFTLSLFGLTALAMGLIQVLAAGN